MMSVKTWLLAFFLAAFFATMGTTVSGEESSVAAARDLYASAAYDEALKMLEGLLDGSVSLEERQAISMYRALCLVALGRAAEADRTIEALVTQDPLYRPAMDDLPPRMRTSFVETRRRLLPSIVQRQYGDAKAAYEREEFRQAADAFSQVLEALADPDIAAAASQPPLSDLKVLAAGFHDLAMKELELPPAPVAAPMLIAPAVAAKPVRDYTRVYSAEDPDVAHPGIVRQAVPAFPGKVAQPAMGVLEVLVDAAGAVESARMRVPVHPVYDSIVTSAAKRWRYQPATVDGVPVKFVKRVQITLTPTP